MENPAAPMSRRPGGRGEAGPWRLLNLAEGTLFERGEGHGWIFDFSKTWLAERLAALADDVEFWERSPLRVYEDGQLLGPAHAHHPLIYRHGGGAFSHWRDRLLFSTSDNTDPNGNGRHYMIDIKGDPRTI